MRPADRFRSELRDKLFFFGAQEWVDLLRGPDQSVTVPTEAMRRGDFSELLNANNGFYTGARVIMDPQTGQPFPGNIIPTNRLSANGVAIMNTYPLPTPGFRQGAANLIQSSDSPTDQRKDHIRFDYRMNNNNQLYLPLLGLQLRGAGSVLRQLPVRPPHFRSAKPDADGQLDEQPVEHVDQ